MLKIKNEIIILSIKITTYTYLFRYSIIFSSISLNSIKIFNYDLKDLYSIYFIKYSLSISYKIFLNYFLIDDDYLNELKIVYDESKDSFKNKIIIAGNILGVGLSKIFWENNK